MKTVIYLLVAVTLVSCTTNISQPATALRPVNESDKEKCEFIKLITEGAGGRGAVSRNTKSAMNTALNKAAELGADSYYIVDVDVTGFGTAVVMEALKCN